jgi:hypothetical protein
MAGAGRPFARVATLVLAALALANAGCLLVAAGTAAGGAAAAGYVYYNGLLYRDYPAGMADTLAALKAALLDLQFPLLSEKIDTGEVYVSSRTADGSTIRIWLDVVPSPIPVEAPLTRVSIRVGFSGDRIVSARILDQTTSHLAPLTASPPPPRLGPPVPAPVPAPPGPAETPAPPVAGPLPARPVPVAGQPTQSPR